jgi:hypothetical protein
MRTIDQHLNGVAEVLGMKGAVFFVQNRRGLKREERIGEK